MLLIMTENDVNPLINNDPMEKRNEFIDHPSYMHFTVFDEFLVCDNSLSYISYRDNCTPRNTLEKIKL